MGLLLWFPLNQDNENSQGLLRPIIFDSMVMGGDPLILDDGKLGQCFSFSDNAFNYIAPQSSGLSNDTKDFTFCCWVRLRSITTTQCLFSCRTGANYYGFTIFHYSNKQWLFDDGARWLFTPTTSFALDTWYHICFVRKIGIGKYFYVNGVLDSSTTTTGTLSGVNTICSIGQSQSNATTVSGGQLNGCLNDVRIYDHALSVKEIHCLAQAKVIHYPLNTGGGLPNITKRALKSSTPTAYLAYQINLSENLVANTTYTMQFWDVDVSHTGKTASTLGIAVYWGGGSIRLLYLVGTSYFTNGHADYISATFTVTEYQASASGSSNLWLNIYNSPASASGTMNMRIGKWKLEKGDTATPWTPNSDDAIYDTMGYNDKTIYDASGFKLNGTSANAIVPVAGSPRNSVAMKFNGTSDKITLTSPFDSAVKNPQMSFAFWINRNNYTDATTRYIYYDYCYIYLYTDYKLRITWHHDTATATANNTWATGLLISPEEWHHICITFNDGVLRTYYDGKLYSSDNRSSTGQFMGVNRTGGTLGTGGSYYFGGALSDFRVYATALSDDDVMALYNTPTSVGDTGAMITQGEFVEK